LFQSCGSPFLLWDFQYWENEYFEKYFFTTKAQSSQGFEILFSCIILCVLRAFVVIFFDRNKVNSLFGALKSRLTLLERWSMVPAKRK
jgi:hypothetical protein